MKRFAFFAVVLVLGMSGAGWSQPVQRQMGSMNMLDGMLAADGAVVLQERGCTNCHSFDNWGEMFGPDLGSNRIRGESPASLAAAMWNQAPSMWKSIGTDKLPRMDHKEAAALFAFFYSRLYFDSEADSPHGEDLYKARCRACHDLKAGAPTAPKKAGPPVETWGSIKDPIALIGRMWDHSLQMLDQSSRQGKSWPRLSGEDARDLLSYLWRTPQLVPSKSAFRFGDEVQGRAFFNERCASCHTLDRTEPGRVDLAPVLKGTTMLRFAGAMWNHAPAMKRKNPGVKMPPMTETEARDLVTYLVVGRAFEEAGHPRYGEKVYLSKQCANCHGVGASAAQAPQLSAMKGSFDPVRMTSVLWSHGPQMLRAMTAQNLRWPRFQTREMLDLIAYLNERAGK